MTFELTRLIATLIAVATTICFLYCLKKKKHGFDESSKWSMLDDDERR